MLASLADAPLDDPRLVYEPKYDGIRAIADVAARGRVRLWSRLGNEKTSQFPEIADRLARWSRRQKVSVVLDGEIVALDSKGEPAGFQHLQRRVHLTEGETAPARVAFIAFDVLRHQDRDVRRQPLRERRALLERLFHSTGSPMLRLSEQVRGDGRGLYKRALAGGWEGLIAKHADSSYKSGRRTPDWRKLKILHEQEFVIGGWTEPRQTRAHFGALLLGIYEDSPPVWRGGAAFAASPLRRATPKLGGLQGERRRGAPHSLIYVGHVGTGFNERELRRVMDRLRPLETKACPFGERPATNEHPHWVKPELVAEVKFTEWTADGKLRHPVYLGLRDDKQAREVRREREVRLHPTAASPLEVQAAPESGERGLSEHKHASESERGWDPASIGHVARDSDLNSVVDQLRALEDARRDGAIELPGGDRLAVTNLHKVFWPRQKITKGALLRYYADVAPFILPAVADRPLVMKRMPNGIAGQPFYQHRAPDAPRGVRVEKVEAGRSQLVGGNLMTLLYMTQLAAISQDPWFSRVETPAFADHVALDLDPMPDVSFARVLEVARWIRDELQMLGTIGFPKSSGADGLHIYIPLPPETPYEAGLLFCQIIATVVADRHPKEATIERAVRARGQRVYVDYLQNILGKTLATAYSARASDYAGVSTPLTWEEIEDGVRREDFTLQSTPVRLRKVGDLWAGLRKAKGADLSRVSRYARRRKS